MKDELRYCEKHEIYKTMASMINHYSTIIQDDSHKEMAFDRLEYLLIFLEECIKNKMLKDSDILEEILSMVNSVDELFIEIIKNTEDINRKVNQEMKDYLLSKTREFNSVTNVISDYYKVKNK